MARYSVDITEHASGPLFDGRAEEAVQALLHESARELAETGRDWIRIDAEGMDRSGRGGTGRASAGVLLNERPYGFQIFGEMNEGQVWWPWLEGTSKRNRTTRFKGYHTFRRNARRLNDIAADVLERHVEAHLPEMGGVP